VEKVKKHRSHISGTKRFLASRMGKKLVDCLAQRVEAKNDESTHRQGASTGGHRWLRLRLHRDDHYNKDSMDGYKNQAKTIGNGKGI
jgi:hypothetical protein